VSNRAHAQGHAYTCDCAFELEPLSILTFFGKTIEHKNNQILKMMNNYYNLLAVANS
jgi:hypothetical protein